jgi:inhibitor of KinA
MDILPYGENGVRLVFSKEISVETNREIRQVYSFLKSASLKGIIEYIPCFTSCLLIFDGTVTSYRELRSIITEKMGSPEGKDMAPSEVAPTGVVEIPVRYGPEYGPDFEFVCSYSGLSEEQVIEIHTGSLYTVFAIGFLPGFPYLGPLDKRLFTPRLETPRVKIPEGSVGLAQLQTGVYSFESPGGWRIIGKTDVKLFDCRKAPYSLLQLGDQVRFVRV